MQKQKEKQSTKLKTNKIYWSFVNIKKQPPTHSEGVIVEELLVKFQYIILCTHLNAISKYNMYTVIQQLKEMTYNQARLVFIKSGGGGLVRDGGIVCALGQMADGSTVSNFK